MRERIAMRTDAVLLPLMLVYGAASLLHFMHNAVYLRDYPNLPVWLTSAGVVGAWLVVAATANVCAAPGVCVAPQTPSTMAATLVATAARVNAVGNP